VLLHRLLSLRGVVGLGLVSYSAYLWHHPILAFARYEGYEHLSVGEIFAFTAGVFVLAYLSWRFVESPFRAKENIQFRKVITIFAVIGLLFIGFGAFGVYTHGFKSRFDIRPVPEPWTNIKCHGKVKISAYNDPLTECLGASRNGHGHDVFLVGDSHAAQYSFVLADLAKEHGTSLFFINTESSDDFPQSFWNKPFIKKDRIFEHILNVSDAGDILVVTFHRGRLNEDRDVHIPVTQEISLNEKAQNFYANMKAYIPHFIEAGMKIYLIEDSPLLMDKNIERCALLDAHHKKNPCAVSYAQDNHTRQRQIKVFESLAKNYPYDVFVFDILPLLYKGQNTFNPIAEDGTYKMFDQHHLTEDFSRELIPLFRQELMFP